MEKEQFEQLLSAVNSIGAAIATAIEQNAKANNAVLFLRNPAGHTLTFRAPDLLGIKAALDDLEGEDVRKEHIASFNVLFQADVANGATAAEAMDVEEVSSDQELAFGILGGRVKPAASGGGGGAAPASDLPSCPVCGGEVWDNRKWIAKYGGDGSSQDTAPPFKCKDKGCGTPIGPDGKRHTFGRSPRGRAA